MAVEHRDQATVKLGDRLSLECDLVTHPVARRQSDGVVAEIDRQSEAARAVGDRRRFQPVGGTKQTVNDFA